MENLNGGLFSGCLAFSAVRNIARNYLYDVPGDDSEMSLRGSSMEVAEKIKKEIQDKVEIAALEILEARITHLAYAPEIAAWAEEDFRSINDQIECLLTECVRQRKKGSKS